MTFPFNKQTCRPIKPVTRNNKTKRLHYENNIQIL
jgi:hypothetical protein